MAYWLSGQCHLASRKIHCAHSADGLQPCIQYIQGKKFFRIMNGLVVPRHEHHTYVLCNLHIMIVIFPQKFRYPCRPVHIMASPCPGWQQLPRSAWLLPQLQQPFVPASPKVSTAAAPKAKAFYLDFLPHKVHHVTSWSLKWIQHLYLIFFTERKW